MKSLPGLGVVRSVLVSSRHVFESKQTVQYPEEAAPIGYRSRGRHIGQRTVWRWLGNADTSGGATRQRARYEVTDEDIKELAYWRGGVTALHRARDLMARRAGRSG